MDKYAILKENIDFKADNKDFIGKGTREKKFVIDKYGKEAFFKYENYNVSEACSEKLAYEIANVLGYNVARIELAVDKNGKLGVLNYFFSSNNKMHTDAVSYLNKEEKERSKYYTIDNIKRKLDELDKTLFSDFIKIIVFDSLIGEQDRHEENWGILENNGSYSISPLYDNGCSLLRDFKNEKCANDYYEGKKDFNSFIKRSRTYFYDENGKRFKHFDIVKYLVLNYNEYVFRELYNLNKLTDENIETIVNKIPEGIVTDKHKEYIIKYIKIRRNLLIQLINGGDRNE